MRAGRFWNRTDSRCRSPPRRAPEANEHRGPPAFNSFGTLRLRYSLRRGRSAGVLVGLFAVALEIFVGSSRGSAARPATDSVGILYVGCHGPSRSARKIMARGIWIRARVYVCRLGD